MEVVEELRFINICGKTAQNARISIILISKTLTPNKKISQIMQVLENEIREQ